MTDHPITPPQWQVDAWCKQALAMGADVDAVLLEVYRAGADQARLSLMPEEMAEPQYQIPKNCWLDDDELYLYPSPCVFDDPDERIDNCVYALQLRAAGEAKTECKYYRQCAHLNPPSTQEGDA